MTEAANVTVLLMGAVLAFALLKLMEVTAKSSKVYKVLGFFAVVFSLASGAATARIIGSGVSDAMSGISGTPEMAINALMTLLGIICLVLGVAAVLPNGICGIDVDDKVVGLVATAPMLTAVGAGDAGSAARAFIHVVSGAVAQLILGLFT